MSLPIQVSPLTSEAELMFVITTAPSLDVARQIARSLVQENLAACVNLIPAVQSIYQWQGKLVDEPEVVCLVKTTRDVLPQLNERLQALHPYDVPEVVALAAELVASAYGRWVADATRRGGAAVPKLP